MPIVRAIRRPAMAAPEGVHFHLDTAGGRSRCVHCIATRAGLEFLAGRQLTIDQLEAATYLATTEALRRLLDAAIPDAP